MLAVAGTVVACATASEPVSVKITNDTAATVTFSVCGNQDCSKRLDPWTLRPGATGAANVEVKGGYNSLIVIGTTSQAVQGCLPLRLTHRPSQTVTVPVSAAVSCGDDGGASAAHGRDWPNPAL